MYIYEKNRLETKNLGFKGKTVGSRQSVVGSGDKMRNIDG